MLSGRRRRWRTDLLVAAAASAGAVLMAVAYALLVMHA
jgi:hypothetical protein